MLGMGDSFIGEGDKFIGSRYKALNPLLFHIYKTNWLKNHILSWSSSSGWFRGL